MPVRHSPSRILFLPLLVFAAGSLLLPAPADASTMEWKGNESAVEEPLAIAVTDVGEWHRIWSRAFGKDAPAVDFGRYFAACVFLGHRAGWWYSIGFDDPVAEGGEYVVEYGLMMLQVEISPEGARNPGFRGQYAMKVFPRGNGLKPVVRPPAGKGGSGRMPVEGIVR